MPSGKGISMSTHHAAVHWQRDAATFVDGQYSRRHALHFAESLVVPGSASAAVVPAAFCDPNGLDPEAAFVASVAGCHMLWFLSLAASAGFVVDHYRDDAHGVLAPDMDGILAITSVVLRPCVHFARHAAPDTTAFEDLHAQAHAKCFIARSVRSSILIECQRVITPGT
jgi:organic hydroperoxide reductase OsmC/OhrA